MKLSLSRRLFGNCLASSFLVTSFSSFADEKSNQESIEHIQRSSSPFLLPPIEIADSSQNPVSLTHWRGKPFLLHLWATWCGPCRQELLEIDRVYYELGETANDIVPIACRSGDAEKIRGYYKQIGITHLPVYTDQGGKIDRDLQKITNIPPAYPTTLIINSQFNVIAQHSEELLWSANGVRNALKNAAL
ncbi:TlpA disulfide reductase family protein [Kozakia baliensis]|uniref:TlpA disulfide reductase family protein n=1 Tax=Kozakia baliensis TaxID=153496 RepID=UPI0009F21178|nr:TlpA disulfide reductase family protein [Kozakia baliensis]GEL64893.1 hypothetical protein KBA01_21790 [Kozakia baliensis]